MKCPLPLNIHGEVLKYLSNYVITHRHGADTVIVLQINYLAESSDMQMIPL